MARRKRGPKPTMFGPAKESLASLESTVCYRTIMARRDRQPYTFDDVINMFYPPETIAVLRAALPHLDVWGMGSRHIIEMRNERNEASTRFFVEINTIVKGMATPKRDYMTLEQLTTRAKYNEDIYQDLCGIYKVAEQFNQVHQVLDWFEENGSYGLAKYYLPQLSCLFPSDHVFHKLTGRPREPKQSISQISHLIRETQYLLAQGALATYSSGDVPTAGNFIVRCNANVYSLVQNKD